MPHKRKRSKKAIDTASRACYNGRNDGRESAESPVSGACPSVDFQGPPESESKRLHFDSIQLHWLWNETRLRLLFYGRRADEGVEIQAAMDFAHWVQFSGLVRLFKENPQGEPFQVDGELIDSMVRNLVMDCGDYLKLNTPGFVRVCHIEAVDRKLDLIAGQLAKLAPPVTETAEMGSRASPALQVIQGGVQ